MASVERPKFREADLVAEVIEERGAGRFIDVMDPDSGNAFRFYESEFSLACAMDGERDVTGIVQWAKDELGITPTPNEVRNVIATLGDLGYLAPTRPGSSLGAPELGGGIVVGAPQRGEKVADVELGTPGARAPMAASAMPKAPDLDLGAPGAGATKRSATPIEDVPLGAPGRQVSDVSIDLADHVALNPDDVKEAVRASKVMSAVEVPKDLMAAMEGDKTVDTAKAYDRAPEPLRAPPIERPVERPVERPIEQRPVERPADRRPEKVKPPVELRQPDKSRPAERADADKRPVATSSGISPVLIILLILAVGAAAVYFGWRYILREQTSDTTATKTPVKPVVADAIPAPPPKPADPTAKIELTAGDTREVPAIFEGVVESIEGGLEPKDVKSGDIIARFVGNKRIENQIVALKRDVEKRLPEVEKARAELDKASTAAEVNPATVKTWETRLADRQKALETKQEEVATKEEELEKLFVRAPFDGKITAVAKPGQRLAESATVVKIEPAAAPTAIFQLPEGFKFEPGVIVALRHGEAVETCTVAESRPDGHLRVVCLQSPNLAAGTDVSLKLP